jgi:hypothetical protein
VAALATKVTRPRADEPVVVPGSPTRPQQARQRRLLRWSRRVERVGAVAIVAVALVPLAVAAWPLLQALDETHRTMGDSALLELGVRRLGSDPLLLGPYSRFGWNHLGPAPFVVLALPYWLTGGDALGLSLGALSINVVSVVGIAVLAWRRGGAPLLAWSMVLVALLLHLLGPEVLRDPWNPHLAIVPLALLVFLAWSVACGSVWLLPVAVGVGSAIVQTHLGFGPVVGLLLAGSLVLLLTRRRSGLLRPLAVTAVVAAVLWAPAVIEELSNDPGNLSTLRTYVEEERETPGLRTGAELASAQLGRLPASVIGDDQGEGGGLARGGPGWPIALTAGAMAVAAVVAWRRRLPDVLRLVPLVLLFAAASVLAASNIDGERYAYLVTWIAVGGLAAWLVVGAALVPWRRGRGRVPALLAGAALVWGISFGTAGAASDTTVPEADRSAVMARLTEGLDAALPPGDCPVLVRFSGDVGWAWGAGVVLALEKAGHDVRVDPRWRIMFGDRAVEKAPAESPALTVVGPNGDGPGAVVSNSRWVQVRLAGGTCGRVP